MARVKVLPSGFEIEVENGTTVFGAATAQGYRWPTICQGLGSCRTCYMLVIDGANHFEEPDDWEQEGLDDLVDNSGENGQDLRLACQAVVWGDAVVRKTGVKLLRSPKPDPNGGQTA